MLRGSSLVRAPFTLAGIIGAALGVFGMLWTVDRLDEGADTTSGWVFVVVTLGGCVLSFACARGCFLVIDDGSLRDVVAWRTVRTIARSSVVAVRVRRGPWRAFEVETAEGQRQVILGAGPVQFPSYLFADAAERDLAAIDAMGAEVRS